MENQGKQYREDRVDIVTVAADDDPSEGYAIGYTNEGEWLEYSVQVKEAKAYEYELRTACGLNTSGIQLFIDDKEVSEEIEVPNTEDWNTYSVVKGKTKELPEGEHILKVLLTGAYANLDWIHFKGENGDDTGIMDEWSEENRHAPIELTVYNLFGKPLEVLSIHTDQIDALPDILENKGYPSGIYLVHAEGFSKLIICK